jgi:hypothetical protein
MEAAEAVIETTSPDVKVDALCVTAHGIVAVGSKMDGRTWHGEVHRTSPRLRGFIHPANQPYSRPPLNDPSSPIQHTDTLARVPIPSSTDVGEDGGPSRVTTSRAGLTSLAIAPDGSINAVSLF